MGKSVTSAFLADLQAASATVAMIVRLTRRDGLVYNLTTHDSDLVVAGVTYSSEYPFSFGALTTAANTGASTTVDNMEMTLACDGEKFVLQEFKAGLWDYCEIVISLVDYTSPSDGTMALRKGWFGQIVINEYNLIKITVVGLLKVLDFSLGRTYTLNCDADFGDTQCKFAVDPSQMYSALNPYSVGQSVYQYDTSLMTSISLANHQFGSGGAVSEGGTITGWYQTSASVNPLSDTSSAAAAFRVASTYSGFAAYVGGYALYATADATPASSCAEQSIFQRIDLIANGVSTSLIDAGKCTFVMSAVVAQVSDNVNPIELTCQMMDVNGNVFAVRNTGYFQLDAPDVWRQRGLVFDVPPGTRTIALYVSFKKLVGANYNGAVGEIDTWYFDNSASSPDHGVIHQVTSINGSATPWTPTVPQPTPSTGMGSGTTLSYTVGGVTTDNVLVWTTRAKARTYDTVAAVGDNWTFEGTALTGSAGTYVGGRIQWLSGDNVGLTNIIRLWNSTTGIVKMYFATPYPIQVGDRYAIIQGCGKTYSGDCVGRFNNGINFRGFPYIPGQLTAANTTTAPVPVAAPIIASVTPATGVSPGDTVTVTGENFTGVSNVYVNGTAVSSFTFVSDTELTFIAPIVTTATANGIYQGLVTVTTVLGTSYNYNPSTQAALAQPIITPIPLSDIGGVITELSTTISGGDTITLGGSNLNNIGELLFQNVPVSVTFSATPVPGTSQPSLLITFVVPSSVGTVTLDVTMLTVIPVQGNDTYAYATPTTIPGVTATIVPTTGTAAGGNVAYITTPGLTTTVAYLYFGSTIVYPTKITATEYEVTVPPGVGGSVVPINAVLDAPPGGEYTVQIATYTYV